MVFRRLRFYYDGLGPAGSGSALSRRIDCDEAIRLIDAVELPSESESASLSEHIHLCEQCRAAFRLEGSLRGFIAPSELPSPSANFEAMLITKIGLAAEEQPATDFLSRWGWALGLATLGGMLAVKLNGLADVARGVRAPALSFYAWAASHLRGDAAVAIGQLNPNAIQSNSLAFGLCLAVIAAGIGVAAVRFAGRR